MHLWYESGTFLIVEVEQPTDLEKVEGSIDLEETNSLEEDNDEDDIHSLKQALEEVAQQKRALEEEVEGLKQGLSNSRTRSQSYGK